MSKDYYKRHNNKKTVSGGALISTDYLRAASYHPTNAQPTTPIIGQRLTSNNVYHYQNAVPGAFVATYLPVFATNDSMSDNSTMRNVGRNVWSSLRNFCTTAVGYQPGDVMNVLLQCGQIPAMFANVKRRMASAFWADVKYNIYNRDVYFMLIPGATETQRRSDIADMSKFVARYNSAAQLFNSIAPPDFFPIFKRWEYLNSNVFTDVDLDSPDGNKFAQYLWFEPQCWYATKLADPSIPGTQMDPTLLSNGISGALTQIEDLLNRMFEDTDLRQILGDLRNTYGTENLLSVSTIEVDSVAECIKPKFDMEVLYCFHNATVMPISAPTVNVNVTTGALEGKYLIKGSSVREENALAAWLTTPKLFNGMKWGVTTDDFIKYTPWLIQQEQYSAAGGVLQPGPELITGLRVWGYDYPLGGRQLMYKDIEWSSTIISTNDTFTPLFVQDVLGRLGAMANFAYSPIWYTSEVTFDSNDNVTAFKYNSFIAELEIPVYMDTDDVAAWHDAVREGLWGLPVDIVFKSRK